MAYSTWVCPIFASVAASTTSSFITGPAPPFSSIYYNTHSMRSPCDLDESVSITSASISPSLGPMPISRIDRPISSRSDRYFYRIFCLIREACIQFASVSKCVGKRLHYWNIRSGGIGIIVVDAGPNPEVIETGTISQRDQVKNLKNHIADTEGEYDDGATVDVVVERADEIGRGRRRLSTKL